MPKGETSRNEYSVIVSDRSAAMLKNHVGFMARVSPNAAEKLRRRMIDEIKSLSFMPQSCPWFNHAEIPKNKYRKKLVAKRYLLIFQIKGDTVFLDYILDCRQNYSWLI